MMFPNQESCGELEIGGPEQPGILTPVKAGGDSIGCAYGSTVHELDNRKNAVVLRQAGAPHG